MEHAIEMLSDTALKTGLLLALAALVTATMYRSSAAARHSVWALTLAGALVLPAVAALIPAWNVSLPSAVLPTVTLAVSDSTAATAAKVPDGHLDSAVVGLSADSGELTLPAASYVHHVSATQPNAATLRRLQSAAFFTSLLPTSRLRLSSGRSFSWPAIALVVWLAGMLVAVAHIVLGALAARRLLRVAVAVTDERWNALFSLVTAQLGVRRRVVLLHSEHVTTPAAWGIFHPVVVLPPAANGWSDAQRRSVLLHELAHVERWDCLTHALAQLVSAMHWFNPLVWWAKHRLDTERERACDDCALTHGARPSSYAEQLMISAYTYQGWAGERAALPMAKPSQLEDRVRRILDRTLQRGANGGSTTIRFGAFAACLVVSIAAIRPRILPQPDTVHRAGGHAVQVAAPAPHASAIQSAAQPIPQRADPIRSVSDTLASSTNDVHWSGTLAPGDTIAINNLNGAIRAEPGEGNRVDIVAQRHGQRDDPKTVQIQIERRDHKTVLCSVYPAQRSTNCDSYDFARNGDHDWSCSDERDQCRSDVKVDWIVRIPATVRLSVSTIAGDITAIGLQNDVAARSVGGHVAVSTAGHVRASSMASVNVSMGRTDWTGDLKLYGGSGLTVTLPAGANTTVEAASNFGRVQSDFPLKESDHGDAFGTRVTGIVGNGGRTLRLGTLGGVIAIRSAGRVADDGASTGGAPVAPRFSYRNRGDFFHLKIDSIMRASRPYSRIDNARIQEAAVLDAMARADISGAVSASLRAADIAGKVDSAMRAAHVERTVDSAMRAADIAESIDSAVQAAHIGETVRDAMRNAFRDSTEKRPHSRQ